MEQKLILFTSIIFLSTQIHSLPVNKKCLINDELLRLIKQLDGYVTPLAQNEVPIGMEFQLIRDFPSEQNSNYELGKVQDIIFVINGKYKKVDLEDNSPLSRKLQLFLPEDQIDYPSLVELEFTIDRIPIEECDGVNHLQPPDFVKF